MTTNALIIIASTLFAECRGEPWAGQYGVASVIWHRAGGKPERMAAVCLKPRQFSCWVKGRYNHARPVGEAYAASKRLAALLLSGKFTPTIRADHYHADYVQPMWAAKMERVGLIGGHWFYWSGRRWR